MICSVNMIRRHRDCWEVQPDAGWCGLPRPWLFLGGSIEEGRAPNWQAEVIGWLKPYPMTVLNPRRDSWNANASEKLIREQIEWELDAQDSADYRVYVFAAETLSPITLLELGVYHRKPMLVYVDSAYRRRLNVVSTCQHLRVPYTTNWREFEMRLRDRVESLLCNGIWANR